MNSVQKTGPEITIEDMTGLSVEELAEQLTARGVDLDALRRVELANGRPVEEVFGHVPPGVSPGSRVYLTPYGPVIARPEDEADNPE